MNDHDTKNVDPKIIDKLQKLLALAGSDNEHEAQLAMSKAEALMREHNLSVVDVAMNGSGAYVQSQQVDGYRKSYYRWERLLAAKIADVFNGKSVRCEGRYLQKSYFVFIAGRTELIIIVDLYQRLHDTVIRMSKEFGKQYKGLKDRQRIVSSYQAGLVRTILNRLNQLKISMAPDDTKNSYGLTGKELMVVKDKAVAQRLEQLFPNARDARTRSIRVHSDAYEQGKSDGNNVSLHRSVDGGNGGPAAIGQ
ncbi:MAG: DUF2786 domain-containing protein [Desulfobulbus sp.]|nr:DUF2786 domain-containing protein [Desulfobulbus sp.]